MLAEDRRSTNVIRCPTLLQKLLPLSVWLKVEENVFSLKHVQGLMHTRTKLGVNTTHFSEY